MPHEGTCSCWEQFPRVLLRIATLPNEELEKDENILGNLFYRNIKKCNFLMYWILKKLANNPTDQEKNGELDKRAQEIIDDINSDA